MSIYIDIEEQAQKVVQLKSQNNELTVEDVSEITGYPNGLVSQVFQEFFTPWKGK